MNTQPPPAHPLMWLAAVFAAAAAFALVLVGGFFFGIRWLVSQPMAFNNPAYMAVIVAGALIIGFVLASGAIISHDAVDAIGDAFKARANKGDDPEVEEQRARTRKLHAEASKAERDVLPAPRPAYQDDPTWPPPSEGGNGVYTG